MTTQESRLESIAFQNTVLLTTLLIFTNLGFALGYSVSIGILTLSTISTFQIDSTFNKNKITLKNILIFLLFFYIVAGLSSLSIDLSSDGLEYHKIAIVKLLEGWNPFKSSLNNIWLDHYSNGNWILSSYFSLAISKITASSGLNLFFVFNAWVSANRALKTFKFQNPTRLYAILIALNPITVSQLWTSYLDGNIAAICTIITCEALVYFKTKDKSSLLVLFSNALILTTLKFTGLIFSLFFIGFFIFFSFIPARDTLQKIVRYSLFLFLLIIICNWNPLAKNFFQNGHLFYPIMGAKKVDIIENQIPPVFFQHNYLERFFVSIFSRTSNLTYSDHGPVLKIPGIIYLEEISSCTGYDIRIGGFGPFFSICCLLSLMLLFSNRSQYQKYLWCLAAFVFLWSAINPAFWWARYSPQLYLVALIGLFTQHKNVTMRFCQRLLLILLILNISFFTFGSLARTIKMSGRGYKILSHLKKTNKEIMLPDRPASTVWKRMLSEWGIPSSVTPHLEETIKLYNHEFGIKNY